MKRIAFITIVLFFVSCKNGKKKEELPVHKPLEFSVTHAKGFSITDNGTYKVLTINSPWANAKTTYNYALIPKENALKVTLNASEYDYIITTPVTKVVATATPHIGFIDALNEGSSLVGFPHTDYVSSKAIRKRVNSGAVKELGKNENLNTELLLHLQPDIVFTFGINAANKALQTVKNAKIPVLYVGEWTEASPLAKAEWLKVFGVMFNKEKQADSIFKTVEKNYIAAKRYAKKAIKQPTVLSGAMYKDIWYLPSGTNYKATLFKDANVNYLWANTKGSGSLELNFETVFNKAKNAELWFNPFSVTTYEALKKSNKHYAKFSAFKNKKIYSFAKTKGETGGMLYYELGVLRPDIVLKDIVKICHPTLLPDYNLFFYHPLH